MRELTRPDAVCTRPEPNVANLLLNNSRRCLEGVQLVMMIAGMGGLVRLFRLW